MKMDRKSHLKKEADLVQDIARKLAEISLILSEDNQTRALGSIAVALGLVCGLTKVNPKEVTSVIDQYYKETVRIHEMAMEKMSEKSMSLDDVMRDILKEEAPLDDKEAISENTIVKDSGANKPN
jgi:hypothetical protein